MAILKGLRRSALRLVRNGRRIYGGLYRLSDGRIVYLAWRWQKEIYRCGRQTISDAVADGIAEWALDYDTLLMLRNEQVQLVGVIVRDTGDLYLTTHDSFTVHSKIRDYGARGGSLQKFLALGFFHIRQGKAQV